MKQLFLPYNLSFLAKEKGFKEPCLAWYNNPQMQEPSIFLVEYGELEDNNVILDLSNSKAENWKSVQDFHQYDCSAPLYQQIIDWFREKHKIHVEAFNCNDEKWLKEFSPVVETIDNHETFGTYNDYYEALNKAIEEAFKLI